MVHSVDSRRSGHPRFVVVRRSGVESALPEANSFLSGCQQFCNIAVRVGSPGSGRFRMCVTIAVGVMRLTSRQRRSEGSGAGLTQRILVSTLEQSLVRGDTAATRVLPGTAPASERDRTNLPTACRVTPAMTGHAGGSAGATRNKE